MLTRRGFATCAICTAMGGLVASAVEAQTAPGGITRKTLQKTDLPGGQYVAVLMEVEIPADGLVPRHTHPGVESTYVLEGGGVLSMKDQSDRTLKPGDTFHVPPVVPHAWRNGAAPTRLVITYVVEKDKPIASPAPA